MQVEARSPVSLPCMSVVAGYDDPLRIMLDDDRNEVALCRLLAATIDDVATGAVRQHAEAVRRFLAERLPLCNADKDDLAPLLAQRCQTEDGIEAILARLHSQRQHSADLVASLEPDLAVLAIGLTVARPLDFIFRALAFIEASERQLAWDGHVLLPLAQQRLPPSDLQQLGARMAQRRLGAAT